MRRTTSLTAAGLLGLALAAVPTTDATAAGETCRGVAATIVGTDRVVTGTEGRDVIVSGAADDIRGLGGDDLICIEVTGNLGSNLIDVDAGPGDDVVDTTAASGTYYVTASLGAGADTFVGGTTSDRVFAGPGTYADRGQDTETDRIDTGAGNDGVFSGSPDAVNHDVVRLGDGNDTLELASVRVAGDAVLDGGGQPTFGDDLTLRAGDVDLALDATRGTFTGPDGTATATGFEDTTVVGGTGTIAYTGSDGDDSFFLGSTGGTPTLVADTGAGDDGVTLDDVTLSPASRIDLGAGDDQVIATSHTAMLRIDLVRDVLALGATEVPARGVEDAWLMAPRLEMIGDDGDNDLTWTGCDARLDGGAGDDSLRWNYDYVFEDHEFRCPSGTGVEPKAVMKGGPGHDSLRSSGGDDRLSGGSGDDRVLGRGGDDRILGGAGDDVLDGGTGRDVVRGGGGRDRLKGNGGDDVLLGGPGRDSADGAKGRDRCAAERERRCER